MGLEPGVLEAVNRARAARGEPPLDAGPSFFDPPSAEDVALAERICDEVFKDTRPRRKETAMPITTTKEPRRQNVLLRAFLMGPTGSGKSLASLELASRVFDGSFPITLINTEEGRGLLYADRFPLAELIELTEDFSPEAYVEALDLAEAHTPGGTIVLDSVSHEWMGAGGVLQLADRFGEWKKVRPRHNLFVQRLLRVRGHLIVTCRAKMKYDVSEEEVGGRKRQTITMLGVGPVQSDDLQYEFNLVGRFDQATKQAEFSGHVDALQGVVSECVGAGAQQVAAAITGWCSAGEPPPVLRADESDVDALQALLLAEGHDAETVERGFNAAKGANRGALHPEWVAEKLKAARERAAAKANAEKAAAGPQEAVSGDGAGDGGSTAAEPVGAGTGAQEAS